MTKLLTAVLTAVPFIVAGPAFAHHMAEGVVSDDIYVAIEENLADSPHLELDLSTVGTASDMMAITTVTVAEGDNDLDGVDDVAEVLASISDARRGQGSQVESSMSIQISEPTEEGLVTIVVQENFGQGESPMDVLAPFLD